MRNTLFGCYSIVSLKIKGSFSQVATSSSVFCNKNNHDTVCSTSKMWLWSCVKPSSNYCVFPIAALLKIASKWPRVKEPKELVLYYIAIKTTTVFSHKCKHF